MTTFMLIPDLTALVGTSEKNVKKTYAAPAEMHVPDAAVVDAHSASDDDDEDQSLEAMAAFQDIAFFDDDADSEKISITDEVSETKEKSSLKQTKSKLLPGFQNFASF